MHIIEELLPFVGPNQPWWVWALVGLVPFCMFLAFREFMCWFWKINKLVGRLEKIERRLTSIQLSATPPAQAKPKKSRTDQQAALPTTSAAPAAVADDDFTV
ncbi:MAG: hypothetical protein KDD69_14605 [Bdellovibrionales bacterium]|nr:hypothetical protein [Bdellovibrionales bacterium]